MQTAFKNQDNVTIGVISDTHGLLRPGVKTAFKDVDLILHAGDAERPEILDALQEIAPLVSIRGNMDGGAWAKDIPISKVVEAGNVWLYMVHNLEWMDMDPAAAGMAAVIYGHTHLPNIERKNRVLYLNPGSAGPRRSSKPVAAALLNIKGKELDAEIVYLEE